MAFLNLPKLGCHQPVKLGVAWELIDKRHKRAADFEQALSCTDIRDIAHLKVGDIKELGKLNPVGRRLVEHNNKLGVCKHCPRCMALQEVIYILSDTRTVRTVLTHTLPKLFLKLHPLIRKIIVRCKVKGQSIGTKTGADSLSKVERFSEIFSPAVPSFREKMSVVN